MDFKGTSGNDVINNNTLNYGAGDNIYGLEGDDVLISATMTNLVGGPGKDRLEGGGASLAVYWDGPKGVFVDLMQGYAIDGWGDRDTLIGIIGAHGSGWDDRFIGDSANNIFWPGGGNDFVDGGPGQDRVTLLADPNKIVFTKKSDGSWAYAAEGGGGTLVNIETVSFYWNGVFSNNFSLSGDSLREIKLGDPVLLSPGANFLETDYFKVSNFGFFSKFIQEAAPAFWYPKETDTHPAGGFSLDGHNSATGDFNGDGLEDLIVTWVAFPHVLPHKSAVFPTIFLNKGDCTFGPANEIMADPMPVRHMLYRTLTADLNADGKDDVVIGSMQNAWQNNDPSLAGKPQPIVVLLSGADGKLHDASANVQGQENGGVPEGFLFAHDLSIGDVDGDGDIDIYVGSVLLLNDGKGKFLLGSNRLPAEGRDRSTNVMSSAIGDLDNDGVDDIVVAYFEGYPRYALLSAGTGFAGGKVVRLPEGPYGLANTKSNYTSIADLNGDGLADIVIACTRAAPYYEGQYLQIFINKGNGAFVDESTLRLDNAPFDKHHGEGQIFLRDVNADGWVDIVHATGQTYDGSQLIAGGGDVFLNDGTGRFVHVPTSNLPFVKPSDLDGFGERALGNAEFIGRITPIDLTKAPGLDFLAVVMTPGIFSDPPSSQATLYTLTGLKPLGRGVDETLKGGVNNDVIYGLDGNDVIDGGAGKDTAAYSDKFSDLAFKLDGQTLIVTTKTEGVDRLTNIETIRASDRAVPFSSILRDLTPNAYRLIAETGFAGRVAGAGEIIGTTGFQDINLLGRVGTVSFDPSFNAGGDIIRLPGAASAWTIQRFGSSAKLASEALAVMLPMGTVGTTLVFADGVRSLVYADGSFKIGTQAFSETIASIGAADQGYVPKQGIIDAAGARLILTQGADIAVGGKVQVIGTPTGSETVRLLGGSISFDPSFNGGGDKIVFPGKITDYTAKVSGSSMMVANGSGSYVVPVGTTGVDLAFDNATKTMLYANGQFKIGLQAIEAGNLVGLIA